MNWLTDYVRPKIKALVRSNRPEVPENLWVHCPSCEHMIFHRDLESNQRVCSHCGHHFRVGPEFRFKALFDEGSWTRIELPKAPTDPLKFRDRKRYVERLKEAQSRTGSPDAIEAAHGRIEGLPAVIAVMNFDFMAGSMGCALGEGMLAAARLAVLQEAAFIVVTASGGARMQEGALSLMQMPRTTIAVEEVKEAGLPYIAVLTDPTTGGVTASFAMLGDIAIAEPGAQIGFAGRRVIEQTIRENLPEDFQKAEYLLEHGMIDMVVHRFELRAMLARLLRLLLRPDLDPDAEPPVERVRRPAEGDGLEHAAKRWSRSRPSGATAVTTFGSELILARLHAPASQGHRSVARAHRAVARASRPSRARARAGGAHRGHQRQGLDARHARRHAARRRPPRAALHLAASGALRRADPVRWPADRRGRAQRGARHLRAGQRRRADHLLRDHHGGRVPGVRPASGRRRAAGDRARRPARCDQCRRTPPAHRALARSRSITRRFSASVSSRSRSRRPAY